MHADVTDFLYRRLGESQEIRLIPENEICRTMVVHSLSKLFAMIYILTFNSNSAPKFTEATVLHVDFPTKAKLS